MKNHEKTWFIIKIHIKILLGGLLTDMKKEMISHKIPSKKIYITGIPISLRFSNKFNKDEIFKEFDLDKNKRTVLFFAGGEFGLGRNTTFMTLKAIIRLFKDTQVVAISGKNQKMNLKFQKIYLILLHLFKTKFIKQQLNIIENSE